MISCSNASSTFFVPLLFLWPCSWDRVCSRSLSRHPHIAAVEGVEAERDQWQRPAEIVQALNLKTGDPLLISAGAGYFALKLADAVGNDGQVLAVDLRRLSLIFLAHQALSLQESTTFERSSGTPMIPHLPAGAADAVLIANTYHELSAPETILEHQMRATRRRGNGW